MCGHVDTRGVFLSCSPPYILRQGLSLKADWLIGEFRGSCLLFPSTGIADTHQHYWLSRNVGGSNPGPHACIASTLPTELSPLPAWVELWRLSGKNQKPGPEREVTEDLEARERGNFT